MIFETLIVDNVIECCQSGTASGIRIDAGSGGSNNKTIGLKIIGNRIAISRGGEEPTHPSGIILKTGHGGGADRNQIKEALIADNLIEIGNGPGATNLGIGIVSGEIGASSNEISEVRIVGNKVRNRGALYAGIGVFVGDGSNDWYKPNIQPISYPQNNQIHDLWIQNNQLEGIRTDGISFLMGCCAAQKNSMQHIFILGNKMIGIGHPSGFRSTGIFVDGGHSPSRVEGKLTSENEMSHLMIHGNTIQLKPRIPGSGSDLISAGITVSGGENGTYKNNIQEVSITNNEIRSGGYTGISLLGGAGWPEDPATENRLSRLDLQCNHIVKKPATDLRTGVEGIALTGGLVGSENLLEEVLIRDNLVEEVLDDFSVELNPPACSNNVIRFAHQKRKLTFPQFANGSGITSELMLTNLSSEKALAGKIELLDGSGNPLTTGFAELGKRSSIDFIIAPLGIIQFRTDGVGGLVTGSARVEADQVIGGVLKFFLPGFGIAGVNHSESTPHGFSIPVARNKSLGLDSGVAIVNTGNLTTALKLTLRNEDGVIVNGGQENIEGFPSNGQIAKYISELFPNASTDSFNGILTVEVSTSGGKITGTALITGNVHREFTTLPVIPLR
jgi:hypothetical protein